MDGSNDMAPVAPEPGSSDTPQAVMQRMHQALAALGPALQAQDEALAAKLEQTVDRSSHQLLARLTQGLSPLAVATAYQDWLLHLAASPGKQLELMGKAARKSARLARFAATCALQADGKPCIEPQAQDRRFRDPAWQRWPFNILQQGFLLQQQWWHAATSGIRGLDARHAAQVNFSTRQMLDILSPTNFLATNPVVLKQTFTEGGAI